MIDINQLKYFVITQVLDYLELNYPAAVNLILGTAAQESHCGSYIKQIGFNKVLTAGGLGIYQMELATAKDILINCLSYKKDLFKKISSLYFGGSLDCFLNGSDTKEDRDLLACNLIGNLYFSTAMCRIHYLRVKEVLPDDAKNINRLGCYWKKYYNTELGKGTVEEFVSNYKRYILNEAS